MGIQIREGIEGEAAEVAGGVFGVIDIEHGAAYAAALHALIDAGEESISPEGLARAWRTTAGEQGDITWQVGVFGAETPGNPGAHAGISDAGKTSVDAEFSRGVVELVSGHGFDEADVVHDFGKLWKAVADPGTGLAVLREGELRAHELGHALDEGEALAFEEAGGAVEAIEALEFWLVVEEFELAGRTGHVEEDDALGTGLHLRR